MLIATSHLFDVKQPNIGALLVSSAQFAIRNDRESRRIDRFVIFLFFARSGTVYARVKSTESFDGAATSSKRRHPSAVASWNRCELCKGNRPPVPVDSGRREKQLSPFASSRLSERRPLITRDWTQAVEFDSKCQHLRLILKSIRIGFQVYLYGPMGPIFIVQEHF